MTASELDCLPRSESDFAILRERQNIYVDKTALIYNLASTTKKYFFSRPRRFGKTLLLSTFESLFKYGLRDFKGLAIEQYWHDPKTYPVIKLDFSSCLGFENIGEFRANFELLIDNALEDANLSMPVAKTPYENSILRFERLLKKQKDPLPVILIDEYDAPVNYCLDQEELCRTVSRELGAFYNMLKRQSSKLRFLFVTGICKYGTVDIFSSGSFIQDISLYPEFSTLVGYTKEELKHYFLPYIENAARVLNLSIEKCIEQILLNYDGFCFDMQASARVLSPWSVLNFLSYPRNGFLNYWYKSSGKPTILEQYIKKHAINSPEIYGKDLLVTIDKIDCNQEINSISDVAMLNQTGYLTIKEAKIESDSVVLNYPNYEVSKSMALLFTEKVFGGRTPLEIIGKTAWDLFGSEDVTQIASKLNRAFLAIDYLNYPIKDEASLRSHIQMYLAGSNIRSHVEEHNALGRSDLEFCAKKRYFVIELKFARDRDDTKKLLDDASVQLKEHQYGEQNLPSLEHVRMALIFSESKRQFVASAVI